MAAVDYCSLADVETYTGINFSDGIGPSDSEIATMITDASRLLDLYAGRQISGTVTHTTYFDSTYNMRHIVLPYRPVASVTSVKTTDSTGALTTLVEGRDRASDDWWLSDGPAGIVRFHNLLADTLVNRIVIEYISGEATVPIEAKMACVFMVARNAIRAAFNDENCTDRIKEMWSKLLESTESELAELMAKIKADSNVGVAVHGLAGDYGLN